MDLNTLDKHLRISLRVLAAIAFIAIGAYFTWFGMVLGEPLSPDTGTWGEFGDFIGGLLNPLVAACALYWLTMSVRLQKDELSATRNELELTRTELAASRAAQEEQARLTLISTQLNTLNMKLSVKLIDLRHARSTLAEIRQLIGTYGRFTDKFTQDGVNVDLFDLQSKMSERRDKIQKEIDVLHVTIDSLLGPMPSSVSSELTD